MKKILTSNDSSGSINQANKSRKLSHDKLSSDVQALTSTQPQSATYEPATDPTSTSVSITSSKEGSQSTSYRSPQQSHPLALCCFFLLSPSCTRSQCSSMSELVLSTLNNTDIIVPSLVPAANTAVPGPRRSSRSSKPISYNIDGLDVTVQWQYRDSPETNIMSDTTIPDAVDPTSTSSADKPAPAKGLFRLFYLQLARVKVLYVPYRALDVKSTQKLTKLTASTSAVRTPKPSTSTSAPIPDTLPSGSTSLQSEADPTTVSHSQSQSQAQPPIQAQSQSQSQPQVPSQAPSLSLIHI